MVVRNPINVAIFSGDATVPLLTHVSKGWFQECNGRIVLEYSFGIGRNGIDHILMHTTTVIEPKLILTLLGEFVLAHHRHALGCNHEYPRIMTRQGQTGTRTQCDTSQPLEFAGIDGSHGVQGSTLSVHAYDACGTPGDTIHVSGVVGHTAQILFGTGERTGQVD